MHYSQKSCLVISVILLNALLNSVAAAQQKQENHDSAAKSSWSRVLNAGYVYQFDTDLGRDRNFSAHSLYIEGALAYRPDYTKSVALSFGYGQDTYRFDGFADGSREPWQEIHSLRFSAPLRWVYGRNWTFIAVPTMRFTAEKTSDWADGMSGGGIAGFSYRFSDKLTIGPGIGVLSQLEDDTSFFPILLVMWRISDRFSLTTGKGTAATQGPGITLLCNLTDTWDLYLGGRYEKERFRLSNDGQIPAGIGENTSFPLWIGATYSAAQKIKVSIIGGVKVGGELRQENRSGNLVAKEDYEPAPFFGVTFAGRF